MLVSTGSQKLGDGPCSVTTGRLSPLWASQCGFPQWINKAICKGSQERSRLL